MDLFRFFVKKGSGSQKKGKRSLPSLRYSLFFIFVASWLIPIGVFTTFIFNQYQNAYADRTESEIMNSVEVSGGLLKYQLDTAAAKLYRQNTGGEWERQYRNLQTGAIHEAAYLNWMRSDLVNTYFFDEQFSCVAFYLFPHTTPRTYTGRNGSEYEGYMAKINDKVLEAVQEKEKQTRVMVTEGNVYLIQDVFLSTYDRRYGTLVVGLRKDVLFRDLPLEDPENVYIRLNDSEEYLTVHGKTLEGDLSPKVRTALSELEQGDTGRDKKGVIRTLRTGYAGYHFQGEGKNYQMDLYYLKDMHSLYYEISRLNIIVIMAVIAMIPIMFLSYYYMKKNSLYVQKMATKDAQIAALQAQINPHFLNNTLEMMNWQARMNGDAEVSRMIEALSTVLDAGIDRDRERLVRMVEELKCADAFLYIMSMRFGERLHVEKLVDRNVLQAQVPQLILQPILENAIKHGVESISSGTIWLNIFEEEKNLIIDVINSGKTMTKEEIERIRGIIRGEQVLKKHQPGVHTSIGIYNVNKRVELIYGEEYGLTVELIDSDKIDFRIRMPLITAGLEREKEETKK